MSPISTSPVADFGAMYQTASSSRSSATTDMLAAAIADKTIRVAKTSWDSQFVQFLDVFA